MLFLYLFASTFVNGLITNFRTNFFTLLFVLLLSLERVAGSGIFSTVATSLTGNNKYSSGVAVGTKIYALPFDQNDIGVIDTTDDAFTTIPLVCLEITSTVLE